MTVISDLFVDRDKFLDKLVTTRLEIMEMYTDSKDDKDWVVAWSGGKDSTVTLGLVTEVIKALPPESRKRRVRVIMSDTKVENPILATYMRNQVDLFNRYAERERDCL